MNYKRPRDEKEISATSATLADFDNPIILEDSKNEVKRAKKIKPRSESGSDLSFPKKFITFLTSLALFITLWEVAAYLAGNTAILAGPIPVLNALLGLLQIGPPFETFGLGNAYGALLETLEVVSLGLGLSIIVGIPIGVLMGRWKAFEMIGEPWVTVTNSIPIVVLIPGLYFSIGGGFLADVFISFSLSVFTVIMSTHAGVKYVSNTLAEVGKSFKASELQFITKIVLPSSLPEIFAGVRIAVGRALLGGVMAEALLGGNHGLGGYMITFEEILNTPSMMAIVVLIALVGIVMFQAPKLMERRLFKWKENERISRGTGM